MAKNTSRSLRNQVMYSIFVRNYSEEGTFQKVEEDLDRIQALGVDIIWLMPIHPLGIKARKGSLGSPYAIQDYRAINPEFGNMDDFVSLVDAIHAKGMKVIIDVVYNHTSPDSWLALHHPEWFYHKEDGSFGNRIGDWTDIIDLDYSNKDLWTYQIETLKYWANYVDGFRCDVAPLVPLDFWMRAREEVEQVRKDCIWLCESVEPIFITMTRKEGMKSLSDSELYNAFDICYDYDIFSAYNGYLLGKNSLDVYAQHINQQEYMYPDNYVKLRFLENHDQSRIAYMQRNENIIWNLTAFNYFQKGMAFLYNGQEVLADHNITLFDKDPIQWNTGKDISKGLKVLADIKKKDIFTDSSYTVWTEKEHILCATHENKKHKMLGIFNLKDTEELISIDVEDGIYVNLIDHKPIEINRNKVVSTKDPIILEIK